MKQALTPRRNCTAPLKSGGYRRQEHAKRIDEEMALVAFGLLVGINAAAPSVSVVLTNWLSMIPALGCRFCHGRRAHHPTRGQA